MTTQISSTHYAYDSAAAPHTDAYLWPVVKHVLDKERRESNVMRVFDLGCGNGAFAAELSRLGFEVIGVDPSTSGIQAARAEWPELEVHEGSGYDDLRSIYGQFPLVVSLEVIEHVYAPRDFARNLFNLVANSGVAIVSTPFHGYWKNLAMALSGKLDGHFTALWDHGHIKFWSVNTLRTLLLEAGFDHVDFQYAGRRPPFSKSMIAVARKEPTTVNG